MQPFDVVVLLFQLPRERIWMVSSSVIENPEHPICRRADRVVHHFLDESLEIHTGVPCDTLSVDFSCADDECRLIRTAAMPVVLVINTQRCTRSRRASMPGPGFDGCFLVSTNNRPRLITRWEWNLLFRGSLDVIDRTHQRHFTEFTIP
jgi:hypothetical protein